MTVDFEVRGDAAWVTFNRPEAHNAMTFAMYDQLVHACERVDADDAIRVMVLRGAGGRAFVAGTDIKQFMAFRTPDDGSRPRPKRLPPGLGDDRGRKPRNVEPVQIDRCGRPD